MRFAIHAVACDGCQESTLGYPDAKQADAAALRAGWLMQRRAFDDAGPVKHWCPECRKALESRATTGARDA